MFPGLMADTKNRTDQSGSSICAGQSQTSYMLAPVYITRSQAVRTLLIVTATLLKMLSTVDSETSSNNDGLPAGEPHGEKPRNHRRARHNSYVPRPSSPETCILNHKEECLQLQKSSVSSNKF